MRAIFKKDFMSAFHSFIGWLFIAIYWFFFSVYVSYYNFNGHYADLSTAVSVMQMILTILIPILCMRSFADERRQKTDQLLFTAPVSIGQIVAGKFFALAAIYSIPCAAACIVLYRRYFQNTAMSAIRPAISQSSVCGFLVWPASQSVFSPHPSRKIS